MFEKDKVIIIIPSYNGKEYFYGLMPLLVEEKYNDFSLEILVVDNNSTDGSVEFLKENYPRVKIIENKENIGYVGANNIGYKYAKKKKAKYIYLLNQDTVITPDFLQPLYNYADKNEFGSLQSKILLWEPEKKGEDKINSLGNIIHFLGFGYTDQCYEIDKKDQKIKKINYSSGAGVFFSMKVLNEFGGLFDETMFMYYEDLDLGWSLNILGYDNILIPESIIYHKYEFSKDGGLKYWMERNRLWVILKNYKLSTLILIFPAFIIMEIAQLFYSIINKYFIHKLRSYSFLLSKKQLKVLKEKRNNIQSKRKRSDRKIFNTFSGKIVFQPVNSQALQISNFFFNIYFSLIKLIII